MKRLLYRVLAFLVVLVGCVASARADSSWELSALAQLYEEFARAVQQKDIGGLESFLTPDYTTRELYGIARGRDQTIDGWEKLLQPASSIRYTSRIESLEREELAMEATAVVRSWGSFTRTGPDGQSQQCQLSRVARETWRQTCEGWNLCASAELEWQVRHGGELVRPGEALEAAALRRHLQPLYDAYANAIVSQDVEALCKAFPSEFRAEEIDGKQATVQQAAESYGRMLQRADGMKARFELVGVAVQGDRATVLRTLFLTADGVAVPASADAGARPPALRVAIAARDTWMKTDRGWSPRASQDLLVRKSVDGEPQPIRVTKW